MPVSTAIPKGRYTQRPETKTTQPQRRTKKPSTILKSYFGKLKLPRKKIDPKELYTAFRTLDLNQLSPAELNYQLHLFRQLVQLIEATDIMHVALRHRREAMESQNQIEG
jgi:hypothetical protein